MKRGSKIHAFDSALVLFLFFLFALASLFLVLFGANVYRAVVQRSDGAHTLRASLSYVTNKVRENDRRGSLELLEDGQLQVLKFTRSYDTGEYSTYLYFQDGCLWEKLMPADVPFEPEGGQEIVQLQAFTVQQAGRLLTFTAEQNGKQEQTSVCLHSIPGT